MAILNIPDRYKPGFVALVKITDEEYRELASILNDAPSSFSSPSQLSSWAAHQAKNIDSTACRNIAEMLGSLYKVRQKPNVSSESLAMDLAASALEKIPGFTAAQAEVLGSRIRPLLDLSGLNLTAAKAKELQVEAERIFCDARIVTDIRPIFGKDVSADPSSAIVVHTLRVAFHESGSPAHKEIYVALDSADIAELKLALERAERKEVSLKRMISKSGVQNTELSE